MRRLIVSGITLDIDEKTAIGLDAQSYDIKDPSKRRVTVSNSFSIPITDKNMGAIGYFGNVSSNYDTVYNDLFCTYEVQGVRLIDNGKIMVEEVSDRISMKIFDRKTIWDKLKDHKITDNFDAMIMYLRQSACIWTGPQEYGKTFSDMLGIHSDSSKDIFIPMFWGMDSENETPVQIVFNSVDGHSARFAMKYKRFFMYLNMAFATTGYSFVLDDGIFTDTVSSQLSFRIPQLSYAGELATNPNIFSGTVIGENTGGDFYLETTEQHSTPPIVGGRIKSATIKYRGMGYIDVRTNYDGTQVDFGHNQCNPDPTVWTEVDITRQVICSDFYIKIYCHDLFHPGTLEFSISVTMQSVDHLVFQNSEDYAKTKVKGLKDITAYDIVMTFMNHFNIIKEESDKKILMRRFDDINNADSVDWSDGWIGTPKQSPLIQDIKQFNYIKYKNVADGLDSRMGGITISCLNKNIPIEGDLFEINGCFPKVKLNCLDFSDEKTIEGLVTIIPTTTFKGVNVYDYTTAHQSQLNVCANYSLVNEYVTYARMINKPLVVNWKRNLSLYDYFTFSFYRKYFIKQLGGYFFVNKISGYNPENSTGGTDIELIKIV